jgi:hypothetical protein
MGLEMRRVDHQPLRLSRLGRHGSEDPVEHAKPVLAHEAIIDRLVLAVFLWRVASAQTIPDDEHNAANDAPIIDPGNAMRQGKARFDATHLRLGQEKQIAHDSAPFSPPWNQNHSEDARNSTGPKPNSRKPLLCRVPYE